MIRTRRNLIATGAAALAFAALPPMTWAETAPPAVRPPLLGDPAAPKRLVV